MPPPPANLACLLSSAFFFLCQLILWLKKAGSWGWGWLLPAPKSQSPPAWTRGSGWTTQASSVLRWTCPAATACPCRCLHSSPESCILPHSPGPWGHLHHDGALLCGAWAPPAPWGLPPAILKCPESWYNWTQANETLVAGDPACLVSSCAFLFLPPQPMTSGLQGVSGSGTVLSVAVLRGEALAWLCKAWFYPCGGRDGSFWYGPTVALEGVAGVVGWAPRSFCPVPESLAGP